MSKKQDYTATLTSDSFLYYELKQILKLKNEGLSIEEIRRKVIEENLFQYKSNHSLKRILSSVMRRIKVLDDKMIDIIINEPLEEGKIINLYLIMKTSRIFFEFMNEIVREKLNSTSEVIEKKDVNLFFQQKAEQSEVVAKWSDTTISKLKQVMMKILSEVGIIEDIKTGKVHRLHISDELKDYLIKLGDKSYIIAMGENI